MNGKGRIFLIAALLLISGRLFAARPDTTPTNSAAGQTAAQHPTQLPGSGSQQQFPPPGTDFKKFLHESAAHKSINCDECHIRQGAESTVKFPSHSACIQCHVNQFTSQPLTICANCHQSINKEAPVSAFPGRQSFNVTFDAKQHELHIGYPIPAGPARTNCNYCHKVTGQAETYPGHPECYTCHTPGANSKGAMKSGCLTCHPAAG